jgi:phage regulator Rha-like protein
VEELSDSFYDHTWGKEFHWLVLEKIADFFLLAAALYKQIVEMTIEYIEHFETVS